MVKIKVQNCIDKVFWNNFSGIKQGAYETRSEYMRSTSVLSFNNGGIISE